MKDRLAGCFALAVVAAQLAGCATSAGPLATVAAAAPSPYRLGAGDELKVNVFGFAPADNTYLISDTGRISLPLVAPVLVGGRTVEEAEAAIADALRAKQLVNNPSVTAQVTKFRPFFILGEVRNPGSYPYMPGLSLLSAVSIAGGYTFRADKGTAIVGRSIDGRLVEGSAQPQTVIQPGDTITIRESWF